MAVDVIEKVTDTQKESNLKFLELEEKRMKLEEKMLDQEDKRRKDEREFYAQMFMMCAGPHNMQRPDFYHFGDEL